MAFRIGDIYVPEPREAVQALAEDALLIGRMIMYSDSGSKPAAFGIVEIGAGQRVVVPVEKLHRVPAPCGDGEE